MQTELFSVSKLFTEALFRIPDYQRGYAWRERQIRDFWTDLEQLESGTNHYTGVLTLEEVHQIEYRQWDDDRWIIESKHFTPYYVVDGQQRLTTIVVLLQCLIREIGESRRVNFTSAAEIRKKFIYESKDEGISRSFIFGYEKDNPSYEFLKTRILGERSDSHSTSEETIYTHNLLAAKQLFEEKLKDQPLPLLESLFTKITQHLLFNVYAISREIDVFVAFETMNNRGKPLSQLELLKNRLIFLSTKFAVDAEEKNRLRRTINDSWKTVYHYLGKNKDRPLDDDLFLSMHRWLTLNPPADAEDNPRRRYWSPRIDERRNYLLDSVFTVRNLVRQGVEPPTTPLSVSKIYEYAHDLKEAVRRYYEISNPDDSLFPNDEKVWMERLRRLADPDEVLVVLSFARLEPTAAPRSLFLAALERGLFLSTLAPYVPRIESFDYAGAAARLAHGKVTIEELLKELVSWQDTLLKNTDLGIAIREWSKRASYRTVGIRYFLFEYEQHLKNESKTKREKLNWEEFSRERYEEDYSTLEHIYPRKPRDQCWIDAFASYSQKEKNALRNCIGNLLPLSQPKNSSLNNKCFGEKKGGEGSTVGYLYGCYSENEVAESEQWSGQEILARAVRLLDFMESRWDLPMGDRKKKVELLGLEFIDAGCQAPLDLESAVK